ncbi:hypothetical protein LIER_27113 [Lithospermum erythrorhizon]|uniref:Protein EDS1L-like n=1 Tax=Lithospermum erythrorhizon TaxID=34254 RepID=A0AAV3RCX2_LITER
MVGGAIGESIGLGEEVITRACKLSFKAHKKFPEKQYLYDKSRSSSLDAVFAFSGTWSVEDWVSKKPFGDAKIDNVLFPSLRSVGNDAAATVNEAFACRFGEIMSRTSLASEVEKAAFDGKQVVFTGHSSGGPIAILSAIWFFEKYIRVPAAANRILKPPYCLTFGSPLMGDKIFSHALRREGWAKHFINFVLRHDLVPRIAFAPLSPMEKAPLQQILSFLNPKSQYFHNESIGISNEACAFFQSVLRSTLSVASYTACHLKECTNPLLETFSSFVSLSPYRPSGTFVFCTCNGKLVIVDNPDAVLQMLFYCAQLDESTEVADASFGSLKIHLEYETELQNSLFKMNQDVDWLNSLADIPLMYDSSSFHFGAASTMDSTLNELGLSERARLCLRAAGESEKQKQRNQEKMDQNKDKIRQGLMKIEEYKTKCDFRKIGYYDAFKLQRDTTDFYANVNRLELAGMWDEIVEMLKRYELPDGFESCKEWIELGTKFRRLLEPLDIANYYRHLKNDDTGPYMKRARPKRYSFTQNWLEHAERMATNKSTESWFWAEVEEVRAESSVKPFEQVNEKVIRLERQACEWFERRLLDKDVFFEESTFIKWWKLLPQQHRNQSPVLEIIKKLNTSST